MNFVKLKNSLEITDYSTLEKFISFGMVIDDTFKGIWYSYVDTPLRAAILNFIPQEEQKYFNISIMQANSKIPPHTDSNIKATINFYIKTSNCLTQFYNFKESDPSKYQVENQTTGFLFSEESIEKSDSFVAKDGEAWLLDVTKPHAVVAIDPGPVDRIVLCLQSRKFNFDETQQLLSRQGNI